MAGAIATAGLSSVRLVGDDGLGARDEVPAKGSFWGDGAVVRGSGLGSGARGALCFGVGL